MSELSKVVIIGAKAVGTTCAYSLQISGTTRELVLIDLNRKHAEAEVLDLSPGLFFTPPVDIRLGDYPDKEVVVGKDLNNRRVGFCRTHADQPSFIG